MTHGRVSTSPNTNLSLATPSELKHIYFLKTKSNCKEKKIKKKFRIQVRDKSYAPKQPPTLSYTIKTATKILQHRNRKLVSTELVFTIKLYKLANNPMLS